MLALVVRALLSGGLIVAVAEVGKRLPAVAALVASLPLVSVLTLVLCLAMVHLGPRLGLRI